MNVMSAERRTTERLAGSDYVARARALIPVLEAAAPRIETERELPGDLLDAMHGAAIFRTLLPRSVGGGEVHPANFVQVTEAIAMGDGSAGWTVCQGSGCSMTAAYLAPNVARRTACWPGATGRTATRSSARAATV